MAIQESSSKPEIVRVKVEKRDANGKLIETKVIEFPKNGNNG
jgi:hypothetical protein